MQPLPFLGQRPRRRHMGVLAQDFRHEPGQFAQPGSGRRRLRLRPQPGHDGGIGQLAAGGITARHQGGNALPPNPLDQFLGQAALADTCLAADKGQLRPRRCPAP